MIVGWLQMSASKSEMRATLLLTLCAACLLPLSAAATSAGDASSPHQDVESDGCPSSRVAAECKACSRSSSGDSEAYIGRCCADVLLYATCHDQLDTDITQSKSLAKRSVYVLDDSQLLDDMEQEKRRTPFLGKRRTPFLGKRKVNPFLGKRLKPSPFLGKRTSHDLEVYPDKRRMPFLG